MNDPSLDDEIVNAASEAHKNVSKQDKDGDHKAAPKTQRSTMPTRWWYCSTAFPLIAGTFGPMANAFSICALVQQWRVNIPPGGVEEHGIDIPDPAWLLAVNAVSLAFALVANISLLLNMAKRLSFAIAQPITILGFWVASVLLIALLAYASTRHFRADGVQNQALSQAFYYGIFAAFLYQIISYLMCLTVYGAYRGAYSKDFELTVAQRTLMLQTISFLAYLLIGALIYCHVEDWKYLDALYFVDFTLLTVGVGDYSPQTHLGRALLFPIAVGGIITVGLVVSSIRTLIIERGAEKMSARMTEKTRRRIVDQAENTGKNGKSRKRHLFGIKSETAKDLMQDPHEDHMAELERRKTEFEAMRSVQEIAARERKYISLTMSIIAFAILWFVGAAVFWHSEHNQNWTYFQSLYFSYTSILTIGYGDFYVQSNSGKPAFVFWSLLAVPALTILISNMGDTVVKGIKDATIWLGEISVLPSNEVRTRDRLRIAGSKFRVGRSNRHKEEDEEDHASRKQNADADWAGFKELHPGLVNIFDDKDASSVDLGDLKILERLADVWSATEEDDAKLANEKNDQRANAEHHFRHLLIRHIPRVYADTKAKPPKRYSYAEWTFYLRLIGQSETDSRSHRRAAPKAKHHNKHHGKPSNGKSDPRDEQQHVEQARRQANVTTKWSWIGPNSPLMQGEGEAEWILERLFEQLEEVSRCCHVLYMHKPCLMGLSNTIIVPKRASSCQCN